ncbi:protein of unknown function [Petrocella atlantisensis]|uniref:Uncharacterized protein n=1 Tax=Petrocella atlantisensis TaxID=2173034 RepID=A0A3P7P552_9FIRM|nr:hypothetical protein [Petrocella atlantisensis]VDN48680.1 protein of unknown function [Petrocella atlantisensis]
MFWRKYNVNKLVANYASFVTDVSMAVLRKYQEVTDNPVETDDRILYLYEFFNSYGIGFFKEKLNQKQFDEFKEKLHDWNSEFYTSSVEQHGDKWKVEMLEVFDLINSVQPLYNYFVDNGANQKFWMDATQLFIYKNVVGNENPLVLHGITDTITLTTAMVAPMNMYGQLLSDNVLQPSK